MSVRKNITISDELDRKLKEYQEEHSFTPVNISKVCQKAIENHLNDYGGL